MSPPTPPTEPARGSAASADKLLPAKPTSTTATPRGRGWHWWLWRLGKAAILLAVLAGLVAGIGLAQRMGWISVPGGGAAGEADAAGQTYTCPMHPQIRQDVPGRCPICGMALVPAAGGGASQDEYAIHVEPAARRLANIQTATVARSTLHTSVRTVGRIAFDESRLATIPAYIDGRIEKLFADYTGVEVAEGDHLAVLYSPQLYTAQVEYAESRRALSEMSSGVLPVVRQTQQKLIQSARQRLVELGMTSEQIRELEKTGDPQSRLTIYTPIGGTVVEKLAVEGKYVKAGEPIYRVADLAMVWLMLELFPEDAARIRFGQTVETKVQSIPDELFTGRVAFVDPVVNSKTRTVGVRVELLNPDRRLRPGDYATATVTVPLGRQGTVYDATLAGKWISPMHPQIIRDEAGQCPICGMDLVPTTKYGYSQQPLPQPTSLVVPRQAVLMAGGNSVVYAETEPGRFEIRPVNVGAFLRDVRFVQTEPGQYEYAANAPSPNSSPDGVLRGGVQILEGLKEGETVAAVGNFLIDSQMQLAGNPSLIDPAKAVQKQKDGPLDLGPIHVAQVSGETGEALENLYAAYFAMQAEFAADKLPAEESVQKLITAAEELQSSEVLPADVQPHAEQILETARHWRHAEPKDFREQAAEAAAEAESPVEKERLKTLWAAREQFRAISHAVVQLAARVRGAAGDKPFTHFFCPMVPGGRGDWLQPGAELQNADLVNPYWGSAMLHCGEAVHQLPTEGHRSPETKEK